MCSNISPEKGEVFELLCKADIYLNYFPGVAEPQKIMFSRLNSLNCNWIQVHSKYFSNIYAKREAKYIR